MPESVIGVGRAAGELGELLARVANRSGTIPERITDGCVRSLEGGGKILFAGNSGSADQCQHLATELVGRFAARSRLD